MNWMQRAQQLLDQLEEKARECPGLYPIRTAEDFSRIVRDHLEQLPSGSAGEISAEETVSCLEEIWRNPEFSYQLNAQSLIRQGASPFLPASGDSTKKEMTG